MRQLSWTLLFLAALLAGFSYWGTSTPSGRQRFDEMAGIIPWVAGLLAALTAFVALALLGVQYWKSR